jgi:lipopolysaccharide/colanic/teichoic acid biosynthesis glycosyltransferase
MLYVWIKLVSPGHFIFKQTRIGCGGKPFTLYKIRTMKPRAAEQVHQYHVIHLVKSNLPMSKLDCCGDSRVIKGGWLLRMSGLDELPQLINVLRGEMSLVGPRPCLPGEFPLYSPDHYPRFSTLPGLTGLWQVERTSTTTFPQMVKMDVRYVRRLSFWLDLKILLKTPAALLGQVTTCARIRAGEAAARRVFSRIFAR